MRYVRVELSRAGQFGCKFDGVIKVIELFDLFIGFEIGKSASAQVSILGEVELADAWRFMLGLESLNIIDVCAFLDVQIHLRER